MSCEQSKISKSWENDLQRKQTEGGFISEMEGDLNKAINCAADSSSLRIWFYFMSADSGLSFPIRKCISDQIEQDWLA